MPVLQNPQPPAFRCLHRAESPSTRRSTCNQCNLLIRIPRKLWRKTWTCELAKVFGGAINSEFPRPLQLETSGEKPRAHQKGYGTRRNTWEKPRKSEFNNRMTTTFTCIKLPCNTLYNKSVATFSKQTGKPCTGVFTASPKSSDLVSPQGCSRVESRLWVSAAPMFKSKVEQQNASTALVTKGIQRFVSYQCQNPWCWRNLVKLQ